MNFDEMLRAFGCSSSILTENERHNLDVSGYLVLNPDPDYWARNGIDLAEVCSVVDDLEQVSIAGDRDHRRRGARGDG